MRPATGTTSSNCSQVCGSAGAVRASDSFVWWVAHDGVFGQRAEACFGGVFEGGGLYSRRHGRSLAGRAANGPSSGITCSVCPDRVVPVGLRLADAFDRGCAAHSGRPLRARAASLRNPCRPCLGLGLRRLVRHDLRPLDQSFHVGLPEFVRLGAGNAPRR